MSAVGNLEFNPFYKLLQTTYRKQYENAQKNGLTICIPRTASVHDAVFTTEFVDEHILAPSPYLKSHYVTTSKKNVKEYEMKDNFLLSKTGKEPLRAIHILAEECGYNKDFEPFNFLIIESPLCHVKRAVNVQMPIEKFWTEILEKASGPVTFTESLKLLDQLPVHKEILCIMDKEIVQFRENYLIHESFLDDAAQKLTAIANTGLEELMNIHWKGCTEEASIETALKNLVESYIMGYVHDKIFPIICHRFAAQDQRFADKLKLMIDRCLTADQLGVTEAFCCSQPEAVVELASLDTLKTPSEKLLCITNTIDFIMSSAEQVAKENEPVIRLTNGKMPCLTSDDLIPILVTVIMQAKLSHVESNLYYLEHFLLFPSRDSKCSFSSVTFQAAVEYTKSNDFASLQPRRTQLRKEISLEELMEVTKEIQKQEQVAKDEIKSVASRTKSQSSSSYQDRELQMVTHMIEASTRELEQVQQSVEEKTHQRSSSLSFLCGHQETFCNVTFGKQT